MRSKKNEGRKSRRALTLLFAIVIFLFILITSVVIGTVLILLHNGIILPNYKLVNPNKIIVSMAIGSIILGSILSAVFSKIPLKPVNTIINAMDSLSHGNFKTRLHFTGKMSQYPTIVEITDSFNNMAEELEKTEMLRTDFVNDFSHEFKTPIASIAGFADLLAEENLSEEEKAEYIRIISEESHRLSNMATNVMNLTKAENQVILTDIVRFNLSEQIRSCILLFENKWTEKQLRLETDFEEYYYSGNQEMLKQVWINLVDNAVKFSDYGGKLKVGICETEKHIIVTVSDTGKEIPPESKDSIFNKFYQADLSHATPGNGIGLSVAKAIVTLHKGTILATSNNGMTVFSVTLPK